jgi:signal peptidase II
MVQPGQTGNVANDPGTPALEPEPEPAAKGRPRWGLLAAVAGTVLLLDQLTKWWAMETLENGRIIDVVWTLRFRLTLNHGAAFSLNQGRGALISVMALVVVAVLVRSGRHAVKPAAAIALGLVVGGAVGNLADRAFRAGDGLLGGGVVDFIDLQWWPVFNLADSAVVCGALLLLVTSWREETERERAARQSEAV